MDISQDQANQAYTIKWLENMIIQKRLNPSMNYEIESKIGKFVGKSAVAHKQLLGCTKNYSILDKKSINYEFQSKLTLAQYDIAEKHFNEQENHHKILRIDFNFSNKDQRGSVIYDERKVVPLKNDQALEENRLAQYRGHSQLIQKKKSKTNHIDAINNDQHYRISMSSEQELSCSNKDILLQLLQRKQKISLIRIKTIHIYNLASFEISLSKVYQIFQSQKEIFNEVISMFDNIKHYNLSEPINKIFDKVKDYQLNPIYELEVEISQVPEEDTHQLAQDLIYQTEHLTSKISMPIPPIPLRKNTSQEMPDQVEKKLKQNDEA